MCIRDSYQAADQGITVFVTTHYMDEAESCNRISIMVDGQIKALDTPARLKKQFGAETMDDVFQKLARGADVYKRQPQDKSGNATVGTDIRLYESKNCIVHASEEKRVVIQGLDGYRCV